MRATPPSLLAPIVAVRTQVKVITDETLVALAREVALATRITAYTYTNQREVTEQLVNLEHTEGGYYQYQIATLPFCSASTNGSTYVRLCSRSSLVQVE